MRKILTGIFICFATLFSRSGFSQSMNAAWASFNTKMQFDSSKCGIYFDAQIRSSDDYAHLQQIIIRPAFIYQFNERFTGTAGYAFVSNYSYPNDLRIHSNEHRLWEQILFTQKAGRLGISHRVRNEHRWINSAAEPKVYNSQQRFRYALRFVMTFKNQAQFNKGWYGVVQDEIMFNYINKETTNNHFLDQNRTYLGTGYRFNKVFDLEGGYMYQLSNQSNGSTMANHVIQMSFISRIGL